MLHVAVLSPQKKRKTYALVPAGIREGDQVTVRLEGLGLVVDGLLGLLGGCGRGGGGLGLGGLDLGLLGVEGADLEGLLVLLEDAGVVVLPELLGGVLAGDAREDLLAACRSPGARGLACNAIATRDQPSDHQLCCSSTEVRTWVFVLELGQIVHVFVDDDPQVVGLVVRGDVARLEGLRHGGKYGTSNKKRRAMVMED